VKIARLKQAKEEAEREVALYRSHLEAEFQKKKPLRYQYLFTAVLLLYKHCCCHQLMMSKALSSTHQNYHQGFINHYLCKQNLSFSV
jgi:hypothetical protein